MIADLAKQAAQARAELETALQQCAATLVALAEAMTTSANVLAEAAEREQEATLAYFAELERQISEQRALS